jgi:hypothetical protein
MRNTPSFSPLKSDLEEVVRKASQMSNGVGGANNSLPKVPLFLGLGGPNGVTDGRGREQISWSMSTLALVSIDPAYCRSEMPR